MQQLQNRCLREAFLRGLLACLAFVGAYAINTVAGTAVRSLAAAAPCQPTLPIAYSAWPVLVLIGCAAGA